MKRFAATSLVTAWAAAGCGPTSPPPASRPVPAGALAPAVGATAQAVDVLAAVLQRQLTWESNLNRVYFVMVGPDRADPPADLLTRLRAVYPHVEPASAIGRHPGVQRQSQVLWASLTHWASADRAFVRSEFSWDGVTFAPAGLAREDRPDHTERVDRVSGQWQVSD